MNINGGALEFDVLFNSGQIGRATEEAKRRIQGLSDATVAGGAKMEAAYQSATRYIQQGFETIGNSISVNKTAIASLEKKYTELGQAAAAAFMKGDDKTYRALTQQQAAVQAQIAEHKKLVAELDKADQALLKYNQSMESQYEKATKNANAQTTLRTQLRKVTEELALLEEEGRTAGLSLSQIRGSEKFQQLQKEAGRLTNAMGDARTQARILAHDNGGLQGVISAVSGVTGAFTVAQGAIGLFGEKNEDLQKIMLRVQSLMAITMGMQQVANTLNKDSAMMIKLNAWWLGVKTKAQVADTAAATAGAAANAGLAGVFRLVGAAIKSVPVFGWILAGISALAGLVSLLSSKAREAKKAQEEFNKSVAETAAKPIATINALSIAWSKFGDNIKAKEKFIEDSKDKFNSLGVSIKNAADAEKLLIDNKDKFIEAQIIKAKALAATELASEKYKEAYLKQKELEETPKEIKSVTKSVNGAPVEWEMIPNFRYTNIEAEKKKLEAEADELFKQAATFSEQEQQLLLSIGQSANSITEGSIAALEKSISKLKDEYQNAATDLQRSDLAKQIQVQESLLAKMDLLRSDKSGKSADPFTKDLEEKKKSYQEYFSWVNAGREKEAQAEFAALLKSGKTYSEYLQKLLDSGKLTKEQAHRVTTEIAQETDKTVIGEFEKILQQQLSNARTVVDQLKIIQDLKIELSKPGNADPLTEQKNKIIEKQSEDVEKKALEIANKMLNDYADYLDRKISSTVAHENQLESLRKKAPNAETDEEREKINDLVALYERLYEAQIESFEELEQVNAESIYRYGTYEQKKLQITKDYEKLIGAARIAGQEDVAKKLEGERDLEISKETSAYKEFFGDISEISIKTLENTRRSLLSMMREAYESGKLTAEQYKQLINEINKQADSAYKGRGMEALFGGSKSGGVMNMMFGEGDFESKISSFKNLFSGAKGDMASMANSSGEVAGNAGEAAGAMESAAGGASGTLAMINAIITAVYQTLQAVSNTLSVIAEYQDSIGNSDAADTLGNWADTINAVNETAMSGWENLKNGNVMGAISDTISMPFKLLTTLNKIHDKNIDKNIQSHADAVKDLGNAYNQLSWEIDHALGGAAYKSQKAAIDNMKEQQKQLQAMADAERSKKKSDEGTAKEYEEQIAQLNREIQDAIGSMANDIIKTDAKSIAAELGNAFIDAFSKGEDAAAAWGEKVDDIVSNIVRNMMIQKLLEEPVGKIIDQYASQIVDSNGNFLGFDKVQGGLGGLVTQLNSLTGKFASEWENLPEELKNMFVDKASEATPTSLSGAIKGASQESIDLLAGQTNAVRVNQFESIEILRSSLIQLTMINANTNKSSQHLESIDSKMSNNNIDQLRSQGSQG